MSGAEATIWSPYRPGANQGTSLHSQGPYGRQGNPSPTDKLAPNHSKTRKPGSLQY
jgi:hypothetical protein